MIDIDRDDIQARFDFAIAADAIRAAFVASAKGQVQAPAITQLAFPEVEGDCCVKTGYITGSEGFVVKVSTGFYRNPARGLSSSNGMNMVFSAETGVPLAILRDEGWLTDIRTGIGGALATAALAPNGFQRVLIVGTGLQARHQAQCLQQVMAMQAPGELALDFVIWGRDADKAAQTAADLAAQGIAARAMTDLRQACAEAQVIVTCTPSRTPLILRDWVQLGTHITAVGADCPGKQELSADLLSAADLLVCDEPSQALHHGELQHLDAALSGTSAPPSTASVIALGDVLSGDHPGRSGAQQITIADLTGLAVQDAAVSLAVLRAADPSK